MLANCPDHAPAQSKATYGIGGCGDHYLIFFVLFLRVFVLSWLSEAHKKAPRKARVPGGQRTRTFSGSDWTQ
jgi:hypothetical protein